MPQTVSVPCAVSQDEDGACCAPAQLRPGGRGNGEGDSPDAAVADLRDALLGVIAEFGIPEC